MKLGVWLPIVSAHPRQKTSRWELEGGPEQIRQIAQAADALGYDSICTPEHIAVPLGRPEGTKYWDPLSTLGFIAAHTQRVRLVPLVLVLGYHHPLDIVKRYGTLDLISGGRVTVGVGSGGTEGEFEMLGAPFHDRGRRADDSMRAIRASLGHQVASYSGEYYKFSEMVVDPTLRADARFWVGGGSRAALRRAFAYANGWAPVGLPLERVRAQLRDIDLSSHVGPDDGPFEIVVLPAGDGVLDPMGDPGAASSFLAEAADAGVTTVLPRLVSTSATHYLDQMAELTELAGDAT